MSRSNREGRGITAATITKARDRSDEKQGLKRHIESKPYMHADIKPLMRPLSAEADADEKPRRDF